MYDTVIIGSGAAGLSAAIYAQRAQLNAVVVEKEYFGTGQIAESSCVDNYPGLPGISGYELGEKLRSHAEKLGTEFLEAEAAALKQVPGGWEILLQDGKSLVSRTVIYAAGAVHRKLGIPGEKEYCTRGVSYCAVCDGAFYAGKTAAVVGGGDTALSDALFLAEQAKTVYLVHRRSTFRASAVLQNAVRQAQNIRIILDAVPVQIIGAHTVTGLRYLKCGELKVMDADGIFVAAGSEPNTAALRGIAELDAGGYVIAGENGVTSAPGLFAAGDVRTKALRQVVTAAADGANCVESVQHYLINSGEEY